MKMGDAGEGLKNSGKYEFVNKSFVISNECQTEIVKVIL